MSDLTLALLDACEMGPWYRLPLSLRRIFLMRGIAVMAIALTVRAAPGLAWPSFLGPEDGAAQRLLTLGASQLAYQDANLNKDYGTFSALQARGYLASELTPHTAIPGYNLDILRSEPYYGYGCGDSSFTMVAMPRGKRLRTFALCDDQTLRYCTDRPDALPCTWPPVEREAVARLRERIAMESRK